MRDVRWGGMGRGEGGDGMGREGFGGLLFFFGFAVLRFYSRLARAAARL